jgi:drug/metabolite transporter (DMT)-like permease
MTKRTFNPNWLYLGPLFVVLGAGLWGTETFFRVSLNTRFDSEVLVFHEHLFCILFTLPFSIGALSKLRGVSKKAWSYLILSGVVGSAIGTVFFTLSLKVLNPSVANVLLNFQPIVTIIFATLLLNERLGRGFFAWAILALLCGVIIVANDFDISQFHFNIGLVYVALTAMAWGFSTVAGRGAMLEIPLGAATLGRFVIGALSLLVSLLIKGKFNSVDMNWSALTDTFVIKNFLLLSIGAGVIPLLFYFKGLSKTPASVAGFCELTQTFTALLLTWGVMGNPLAIKQIVAGALLLVCVYRVNLNFAEANYPMRNKV